MPEQRKPTSPQEAIAEAERRISKARRRGWMSLHLTHLGLMSLPATIRNLTELRELDLSDNRLTSLPEALGVFAKLQVLNLWGNQLTALPEAIGKLTQLEWLDLQGNDLRSLPQSMRNLWNLRCLFLHGNEALGLLPEVLGATWQEAVDKRAKPASPAKILDYYFRVRAAKRPLNEAKLILVGHGLVGKTSLVKGLLYGTFDPHEKETDGIQISDWRLRLSGDDVRLRVWDFGGQEIMHATHQFFLTERSLYLLVLNGRGGHEDSDAEYWLNLIQSFGAGAPVIVVLNKSKEHPFDLNRGGLRQKFPAIKGFVATDCADRTGIAELRTAIGRETDALEHLRAPFPAAWFDIKDRLSGMKENYVTFEQYRGICGSHGETEREAQDALAVHLHNLGIALNYKDDPRLRDTHVLNPRWVTEGIYAILTEKALAARGGDLHVSDLAGLLDTKVYPPERHSFLLELMEKFELCFPFPDTAGHYLVPEVLPKDQSPAAERFHLADCLNFEYHYPVLPEGLLPRFIVRSHVLSCGAGGARWRTGAILEFEGCRALVKGDKEARKVQIAVSGPRESRRRLLAVIRYDFEHIHTSFTFRPVEKVPVPGHPELAVPYEKLRVLEARGVPSFTEVVGDEVLDLTVADLLNGVDLVGVRPRPAPDRAMAERGTAKLFYSYSHKDERFRDELGTHLKLLQRQGLIEPWHDRRISEGTEWKGEIDRNLEEADIILLLVSADFIASDYCCDIEMKRALERYEAGEARVIPIIVRDVSWHAATFGKLKALPTDGKAVTTWPDRDTAWRNVAEGIEKVVREIRAKGEWSR